MKFVKGKSGNPGGRPKSLADWRRSDEAQRLRDLSYFALEACVTCKTAHWRDRVTAAGILLDRTEGKPVQPISGVDDGPIRVQAVDLLEILQGLAAKSTGDPTGEA